MAAATTEPSDERPATLSVVMPVYNARSTLPRAFDALARQTFTDFELIAVDDGSTDGSGAWLDAQKPAFRLNVVHQENQGAAVARNVALAMARGEYVEMVDADDLLHPRAFEWAVSALEETRAPLAIFDYRVVRTGPDDLAARWAEDLSSPRPQIEPLRGDILNWFVSTGRDPGPWEFMFRRAALEGVRFPEGIMYEDNPFVFGILAHVDFAVHLPAKLYGYVMSPKSVIHATSVARRWKSLETVLRLLKDTLSADQYRRLVKDCYCRTLRGLYREAGKRHHPGAIRRSRNAVCRRLLNDGLLVRGDLSPYWHFRFWLSGRLASPRFLNRVVGHRAKLFGGRSYDFVTSLGDNCAVAECLRVCRLREMSGPFDWNGVCKGGLALYAHFFETNFNDFLVRENLVRAENRLGPADDKDCDYYYDRTTGYLFLHDFRRGTDFANEFEVVRQKYARRIERFVKRMSAGGRILLVHSAKCTQPDVAVATDALRRIRAVFKNEAIDLLVIRNDPNEPDLRVETSPDGVAMVRGEWFGLRFTDFRGNMELLERVCGLINYRHHAKTAFRDWFARTRARLAAAFIIDRERRRAYRRKLIGGGE